MFLDLNYHDIFFYFFINFYSKNSKVVRFYQFKQRTEKNNGIKVKMKQINQLLLNFNIR